MKWIISILLILSGCDAIVTVEAIDIALERCNNNGGLVYLSVDEDNSGGVARTIDAHCKNTARFKVVRHGEYYHVESDNE